MDEMTKCRLPAELRNSTLRTVQDQLIKQAKEMREAALSHKEALVDNSPSLRLIGAPREQVCC
jgi:hypothetical protein